MCRFFLGFIDATNLVVLVVPVLFLIFWGLVFTGAWLIVLDPLSALLLLWLALGRYTCVYFWTIAYQNEKISVLAPYTQTSTIISIVAGFFLFPGITSPYTLAAALIAAVILLSANLELGKIHFTKNCLALLIAESAQAIQFIFAAKLLLQFAPESVFLAEILTFFVVTLIVAIAFAKKIHLPTDIADTKKLFWYSTLSNFLWSTNALIALFLVSSLGLTLTVLLSMISLGVSLALSYGVFRDIPSKKDVAISVALIILIGVWLYFSPQFSLT
jgi:hypothetical protein